MDSNIEIDASPWDDVPELSLKKTLFTDAWLRQISIGKMLGIALLMEIDLEPLHLPDVLEADPTQDPERSVETYRGTSSLQSAPSSPTSCRGRGSGWRCGGRAAPSGNFVKSTEIPEINLA